MIPDILDRISIENKEKCLLDQLTNRLEIFVISVQEGRIQHDTIDKYVKEVKLLLQETLNNWTK